MSEFSYFLGIDQTGAAICNGAKAKPLKVCLAVKQQKQWKFYNQINSSTGLTLLSLSPKSVSNLLSRFDIPWPNAKVAILADCVFGLPEAVYPRVSSFSPHAQLWRLFSKTLSHSTDQAIFGMKVSESFFSKFLSGKGNLPRRECEIISGSSSIFTTRPFQKNIQTGSYRIWRDLVSENSAPWLNVWPFATPKDYIKDAAWIFEGYPSFFWRELLGLRSRNASDLIKTLKTKSLCSDFHFDSYSCLKSDPDLCDATVLALGGVLLQDRKKLITPFRGFWKLSETQTEGWISGITP